MNIENYIAFRNELAVPFPVVYMLIILLVVVFCDQRRTLSLVVVLAATMSGIFLALQQDGHGESALLFEGIACVMVALILLPIWRRYIDSENRTPSSEEKE